MEPRLRDCKSIYSGMSSSGGLPHTAITQRVMYAYERKNAINSIHVFVLLVFVRIESKHWVLDDRKSISQGQSVAI